jgi:hypothetical protein
VSSAFKVVDFLLYGSSIFKATTPTAKETAQKLGIFAPSHLERLLYTYLHLKNYLPQELVNKCFKIDLDCGILKVKEKQACFKIGYSISDQLFGREVTD